MFRPNPFMEEGEGGIFSKALPCKLLFLLKSKIKQNLYCSNNG